MGRRKPRAPAFCPQNGPFLRYHLGIDALFRPGASACYFAVGPFKEWVDVSLVPLRFALKTALFLDIILAWMLCFVPGPRHVTLLWAPSKNG